MKNTVFICFILCLLACESRVTLITLKEYQCKPDTAIELYPDSSFFGFIGSMLYYKGKIYASDTKVTNISICTENFDSVSFIGSLGQGPGEFIGLHEALYVCGDTLHAMDAKGILRFNKGQYIDVIRTPIRDGGRFAYFRGQYYIPYSMPPSTFAIGDEHILPSEFVFENIKRGGTSKRFANEVRTIHSNHRILLIDSGYIYLVSYNLPHIEKFDINTLALISTFDLSVISVINEGLQHEKKLSLAPNSIYNIVRDGYIVDDILYLLITSPPSLSDPTSSIVQISLYPEMKALNISRFDGHNTTFCVTPNYIFTFDGERILRFKKTAP
jgi:hypothetical protein